MENEKKEDINILAIDDNQDNLITLRALIKEFFPQATIYTAQDGRTGLLLAEQHDIDVVLLDIVMPQMDGYEVCSAIKSNPKLSGIPVIFLTAIKGDRESRIKALEVGGDAFLAKPIDESELIAQIQAMLKVRYANKLEREEKNRLNQLVEKQTSQIMETHLATLQLLEDLKEEVEKRKKREAELEESESKFRALFKNNHAVMLLINPETGKIIDVNPAACKYYGWAEEVFLQKNITGINTLSEIEIKEEMKKAKEEKRKFFQFSHRLANGEVRDVEVYSGPIEHQGTTLLYSIVHDVSERKRSEEEKIKLKEQLLQAQKMESIGRLAGGVAHDFNNMLGVIMGHTELAMLKTSPEQEIYHDLEVVMKAAERSTQLTRQLLAYARKQTVMPKVIDLNSAVSSMLTMLRRLIPENVKLHWTSSMQTCTIKIDPSQLDQILSNLIINAGDAIDGGGNIRIQSDVISVNENDKKIFEHIQKGEFVVLSVSDDGCGMDDETLANIFEPFFTTKEINKGTGLGLATVYGIVKQNNGFIVVSSKLNEGTRFDIYFPRVEESSQPISLHKEQVETKPGKETILLIEDEEILLDLVCDVLEIQGYNVIPSNDAFEALKKITEHQTFIDMVVTDVIMPGMNGKELVEELRKIQPNIKCLYISGYSGDIISKQGILESGTFFIQKPFTLKDFGIKIRQILDGLA